MEGLRILINRKIILFYKTVLFLLLLFPSLVYSGVEVKIDTSREVAKISPLLWGANVPGWDYVSGKLDGDLDDALKSLGISVLRFPGGFVSDVYHWEYGTDAFKKKHNKDLTRFPYFKHRKGFLNNAVGINEFASFAEDMKAQTLITVNVGTGTVEEAANWVEYVNGGSKTKYGSMRVSHGLKNPLGVKYWELGNELYGEWHVLKMNSGAYAEKVKDFSKAMKAKDPSIKIGIIGGLTKRHVKWMYDVIEKSGSHADFLSLHFYYPRDYGQKLSGDSFASAVMASPFVVDRHLTKLKNMPLIKANKMPVAVTEFNTQYSLGKGRHKTDEIRDLKSALSIADLFQVFVRQDIFMSNVWSAFSPVNNLGLLRYVNGKLRKSPTYYVFSLYANDFGSHVVETKIEKNSYEKVFNFYEKGAPINVPQISVMATLSDDSETLYLAIVNRSLKENADLSLNLAGFDAEEKGTAWTVTGAGPYETNDGAKEVIKPVKGDFSYKGKISVPPISFTKIKLKKKQTGTL